MLIKIDIREQELFKKCETTIAAVPKFAGIQLVFETLPLGDIIIQDDHKEIIIIERKTLTDLASSIKDGRYEEQSYRLNGLSHHNHNIIYLIEGDMSKFNAFKERIDKQTLYSAMFSINYFKGFSLMRSNTMNETAFIVCNMVYKLSKDVKPGYYLNTNVNKPNINEPNTNINEPNTNINEPNTNINEPNTNEPNDNSIANSKEYCNVVKKVKKENINANNISEIMLCQIPGVSSTSALAIFSQFKTLPNLINSLKENPNCLNNIVTTDSKGKNRKISKTAISTIVQYLT